MSNMDKEVVFQRLREWLAGVNPAIDGIPLGPGVDLIESRILESLQVVEFILFIEMETGEQILTEDLNPNNLRTLDSIYESFFRSSDD